ncbi:MAG: endolytic transglycosylase MltG [Pseudomonadota bacterium]
MRKRRRDPKDTPQPRLGGTGDGVKRRPAPLVTKGSTRSKSTRASQAPEIKRRSATSRHPVVFLLNFVLFFLVISIAGAIAVLAFGRQAYVAQGPLNAPVQLNIPRGASVQSIAAGLEAQNIISNQYVFMAAAYTSGATRRMQAGEYVIPAGASIAEVIDKIVSGDVVQHQITIAEGLSSAQVVRRLNENPVLSGSIGDIPPEGSLLPETYAVTRGMERERVLQMMRDARERVVAEAWNQRDPDLPLSSPAELVTLASIVEKETGAAEERALVAGVFVNRLNRRMRLQSDPTILYGIYGGEAWERPRTIYRSDLERPNSYNTYQIPALPPGPITNPGSEALMATANPAETTALYFVADGTGGHAFAETYEEHQRNVARWREIERARDANSPSTTE